MHLRVNLLTSRSSTLQFSSQPEIEHLIGIVMVRIHAHVERDRPQETVSDSLFPLFPFPNLLKATLAFLHSPCCFAGCLLQGQWSPPAAGPWGAPACAEPEPTRPAQLAVHRRKDGEGRRVAQWKAAKAAAAMPTNPCSYMLSVGGRIWFHRVL